MSGTSATSAALRRRLADQLEAAGHLHDPAWREAIEAVPREVFVGGRFYEYDSGSAQWEPVTLAGTGSEAWLELVYSDQTLVTQIAGADLDTGDLSPLRGSPSSSSTLPSLVVRMLEELAVGQRSRVLEVGTGTGYSTALLTRRLGPEQVTSVELDPAVARRAAFALHATGYHPALVTGDGLEGYAPRAPYDQVIATCSVLQIPHGWMEQAVPGAVIITALTGWLHGSALAKLTTTGADTAEGGFLPGTVSFMQARAQTAPVTALHIPERPESRPATLGPGILSDWNQRWLAQLAAPGTRQTQITYADAPGQAPTTVLHHPASGSFAWLDQEPDGSWLAAQSGPLRIWNDITETIGAYHAAGSPPQHEFRLTISRGRQTVSHPKVDRTWNLPGSAADE